MNITNQDKLELYKAMVRTRMVEQAICDLFAQGLIKERQHASIGQEAIGVGACYGLRPQDQVMPSLRTRAAFLMKGVPVKKIMAGLFGKVDGPGKGKNTSHHMGDPTRGIMAGSGVLGGSVPVAVGAGLAAKIKGEGSVSVVFFGDGASNRGDVHEAMNFAAIYKLPVIFIIENNQYAWTFPVKKHSGAQKLSDRAAGYGIPGYTIDGNDVLAVYETMQKAVSRARSGEGPTLIECLTYRWRGHSERDANVRYRPEEEIKQWLEKCPIKRLEDELLKDDTLNPDVIESIKKQYEQEIKEAIRFAQEDPYPDPEETLKDVFAKPITRGANQ